MTAGATLLDLIGERTSAERAPAVRAFAEAFLRRLAVDGDGDGDGRLPPEGLCGEIVGLFEFASARGEQPIAVRAFTPTLEEHGYETPGSVVETNTEDWPFLVDSVSAGLRAHGLGIQRVLHPILGVERGADGAITAVLHPREASRRESVMHFDLDRRLEPKELEGLTQALRGVLEDVRRSVQDFPAMADRSRRMVQLAGAGTARYADDEVDETVAFLEWLLHDNFIFLGYREYRFTDATDRRRPRLRAGDPRRHARARSTPSPSQIDALGPEVRKRAFEGDLLIVSKTNRLSRVHRRVRMDYVGVRRISAQGEIVGEARMLGLFTTKAYAEPSSQTPLLHRKLRQILRHEDLIEGSHDYKAAVSLFDSFPKDELFAASTDDLRGAVVALLALQGQQVRLLGRRDPDSRSASMIVALPRSRYDGELLERLIDHFRVRFSTPSVDSHLVLGEGDRVQIHFRVHASAGLPDLDFRELEREVVALTRTWDDELRDLLVARHGEAPGPRARGAVGAALPALLQGLAEPAAGDARHRLLRAPGDARRAVRGRAPERDRPERRAHPHRALQGRRQGRARRGDADARGPRPARDRGGPDAPEGRRRRDLGAGLRRARRRPAARPPGLRRARGRLRLRRLARRHGVRLPQPARAGGRARLAPDRDPARLPQVPPADRLALHRELPERRAGAQRDGDREARAPVRAALRPRARARRGRRGGAARGDRRRPRRGRVARRRPHPAQPARADRGDAAHQRLPPRARRDGLQAALGRRARDPAAGAADGDLRLLVRDGGDPPARRPDRARRHPLVRSPGLPHRGPRADARPADQERPDRPRGRQGRLLPQAAPVRPGRAARGGPAPVRGLRAGAARRHRQPRRRRGRAPARRPRARRGRHLPRRRRRQGHRDVLGHRQRRRGGVRLLARRRLRLGRLERL